jgi:hypothetical protein
MNIGHKIQCPVCDGYKTTSRNANLTNHIKNIAKTELFAQKFIDKNIQTPHVNYIKNHSTLIKELKNALILNIE